MGGRDGTTQISVTQIWASQCMEEQELHTEQSKEVLVQRGAGGCPFLESWSRLGAIRLSRAGGHGAMERADVPAVRSGLKPAVMLLAGIKGEVMCTENLGSGKEKGDEVEPAGEQLLGGWRGVLTKELLHQTEQF